MKKNTLQIIGSVGILSLLLAAPMLQAKVTTVPKKDTTQTLTTNDNMITTKVKAQLLANSSTEATSISVITTKGVVTLSGVANSLAEAITAIKIAEAVSGVKNVDASALSVRNSKTPVIDTYTTAKVKSALAKNELFGQGDNPSVAHIKVTTRNKVVYLNGTVENKQQKVCAQHTAAALAGVDKVVNELKIKKQS